MKNKIVDLLVEALYDVVTERESPLTGHEEDMAKHMKPALKKMQQKYGDEKGKEYFYGHIRNLAKEK